MAATKLPWGFYGRQSEIAALRAILARRRFFFLKVSGRRRIGKTSLVHQVMQAEAGRPVVYLPIPDSDPAGVVSQAREFLELFGLEAHAPADLRGFARAIAALVRQGRIVALDEFQYFARKTLYDFNSLLQTEVDQLAARAAAIQGGLIVLGSIHTGMSALLEDRHAPLFNRLTDSLHLGHLDLASVLEILRTHADEDPGRLLFLWNMFEGVPKFYRDCYEQDALASDRTTLLRNMFFSSASPLRTEAENWFLRELRGRYDLVLKFIARNPGCSNGEITEHARSVEPESEKQVGGYLKILRERYQMIEALRPIFARPTQRNSRYYMCDNFLRSWLAALAAPAASMTFRPVEEAVAKADERLREAEGHGLERLVGMLYEERARKGIGDFALTERVRGYWDQRDTEIDLVAIDEGNRTVRLGACRRNPEKLLPGLARFEQHVERFLAARPALLSWRIEKAAITVRLPPDLRSALERRGYLAQDLPELIQGL
jgi:hypothetical protein